MDLLQLKSWRRFQLKNWVQEMVIVLKTTIPVAIRQIPPTAQTHNCARTPVMVIIAKMNGFVVDQTMSINVLAETPEEIPVGIVQIYTYLDSPASVSDRL